jgi:prolyl 4-hydroxylase
MASAEFDEQWQAWVDENVSRGCSKDELYRILLAHGFEPGLAGEKLGHVPWATRESQPRSSGGRPDPAFLPKLERIDSPLLELYTSEDFLTPQEGSLLIELMRSHLRPSTISAPGEPDRLFRRSRTCDLSLLDHAAVRSLDERICAALQIPQAHSEPMQGQYYGIDDEFKAHTDYFETYEIERFSTPVLGQRTWTFMIYLNEPHEGGETAARRRSSGRASWSGRRQAWRSSGTT